MMTDACTLTAQHTVVATPIGGLTVVREGQPLTGLYFPHHWYKPDPVTFGPRNDGGFEGVAGQLEEYLAGTRTLFDLPLEPRGTEFQLRVWELITQVPYGQTTSYGDLARRLGGRENAQEVGAAVGRNPLCILIPCHRVIAATASWPATPAACSASRSSWSWSARRWPACAAFSRRLFGDGLLGQAVAQNRPFRPGSGRPERTRRPIRGS